MSVYTLKQYNRPSYPGRTVGVLTYEWSFEATDLNAAVKAAKEEYLEGFQPPNDFAVMLDENGKVVWEDVRA